jgi:hypothetical protein
MVLVTGSPSASNSLPWCVIVLGTSAAAGVVMSAA